MQATAEVRRVLSRRPNSIKLKHFLLRFGAEAKPQTVAEAAAASRSRWLAAMTAPVRTREI